MGQVIALRAVNTRNSRAARIFEAEQRRDAALKHTQSLMLGAFAVTGLMMIALSLLSRA